MNNATLYANEADALSLGTATVELIEDDGVCWISGPDSDVGRVRARLTGALADRPEVLSEGAVVIVAFDRTETSAPIIIDVVAERVAGEVAEAELPLDEPVSARVDGEEVAIEGQREITLRCGRASLTLQRNGKIVLKGDHILSYSRGTNRIKGGSVKIN